MCIGRNYASHIAELNSATPKQPFFFLKPSSSILLPQSGPMLLPKGVNVHYEVELGLVIGKTVRDLREDDEEGALGAISGMLDISFYYECIRVGGFVLHTLWLLPKLHLHVYGKSQLT